MNVRETEPVPNEPETTEEEPIRPEPEEPEEEEQPVNPNGTVTGQPKSVP